jgi:hypothetical protein
MFLIVALTLGPACDSGSNADDDDTCPAGQIREGGRCVPDDGDPVPGCTDSGAHNYDPAATTFDGSCEYDVLFQVDMSDMSLAAGDVVYLRGDFNDFAATADALSDDDGDDVWTTTLFLLPGTYEYEYAINDVGSSGTAEEVPAECDYDDSDDDVYRGFQLGSAPLDLPLHKFGECTATAGPGCMDADAANYDPYATVEDGSCTYDVAFSVDMSCSGETPTTVAISGPFCSWCDTGFELSDGDHDGVWTGTFAFAPGKLEYKYMVDQFAGQEELIDDMVNGASCAPITDYSSYANRELTIVDAPVAADDIYGRCDDCPAGGAGCTDSDAWNYDVNASSDDGSCLYEVTFNVDMSCAGTSFTTPYITGPFCSWCDNGYPLTDGDGDGVWTGSFPFAPGDVEFKYMVDNFAGQENLVDDVIAGNGACAPVTDGSTYANRKVTVADAPVTSDDTYGSCDACATGGPGCTDADANNYDPGASSDDGSCTYDVTFSVDMGCAGTSFTTPYVTGPFCSWCDAGFPLADGDGDGVWTGTYSFAPGAIEFKYMVDNFASQEDLVDDVVAGNGSCAPVTDGSTYANRQVTVVDGPVTAAGTYGSCDACATGGAGCTDSDASNYDAGASSDDGSCTYAVNFSLDMSCAGVSFTTPYIAGPFNGWCADCHPLSDGDGDGVWTASYVFAPGALEYKYQLDAWSDQEDLIDDMVDGGSCAPVTDYSTFANRQVTIVDAPLDPVDTYGQCTACP